MSTIVGSWTIELFAAAGCNNAYQIDSKKCSRTITAGDRRYPELYSQLPSDTAESREFRHSSVGHCFGQNHQIWLVLLSQGGNGVSKHHRRCAKVPAGKYFWESVCYAIVGNSHSAINFLIIFCLKFIAGLRWALYDRCTDSVTIDLWNESARSRCEYFVH